MRLRLIQLGVMVFGAGLVSLAFGFYIFIQDSKLKSWPTTLGEIVSSKIIQTDEARQRPSLHETSRKSDRKYRMVPIWTLDVDYRYSVGGKEYRSRRATSCDFVEDIRKGGLEPGATLRALEARFRPGITATVHFNPTNPGESYLAYMDSPTRSSFFTSGAVLLVFGLTTVLAAMLLPSGN